MNPPFGATSFEDCLPLNIVPMTPPSTTSATSSTAPNLFETSFTSDIYVSSAPAQPNRVSVDFNPFGLDVQYCVPPINTCPDEEPTFKPPGLRLTLSSNVVPSGATVPHLCRQMACCVTTPPPHIVSGGQQIHPLSTTSVQESPPPDEPIPSTTVTIETRAKPFGSRRTSLARLNSMPKRYRSPSVSAQKKSQSLPREQNPISEREQSSEFISREEQNVNIWQETFVAVRRESQARLAVSRGSMANIRTPLLAGQRKVSSVDNGYLAMQNQSCNYFDTFDRYVPYEYTRKSLKRKQMKLAKSFDDRYANGGVRFDASVESAGSEPKQRANSMVRVIRRRQSGYGIAISSESTAKMRCRLRKQLFVRRNKVCDLSLLLAIIGLILVIVDSELTALHGDTKIDKDHWISLSLRGLCVISTLCLLACLVNYHSIEVKIALIDSGADDWRVAVSTERIFKLTMELAVCSICPFPGTGSLAWPFISPENRKVTMIPVPIDVLLSVPMFLRSYLVCRFMVLHSKQFQDAATRSIAALNRISMDFRFVIKTMMSEHPLRVLIVFTVTYWICMSWMFTQCERYDGKLPTEHYYLNSMWFIMVTFMSIGYGDIVPNTYCGRTLSITTGIVGAGVSSALIAVISRKLELSRAEKHVNNFMADSKLTNQRKNAAASVLQETWFIHKYKKALHKGDDLRLRHHQRRFLHSITEFRRIKWDQRKLQEKGNSLLDVGKLHSDMHETLWEMHRTQDHFIQQVELLTQKIVELQASLVAQNQTQNQPQYVDSSQSTPQPNPMMHPSFSLSRLSVPRNQGATVSEDGSTTVSQTICPAGTVPPNSGETLVTTSPSYTSTINYAAAPLSCQGNGVYATVTTPLMTSVDTE